MYAKQITFRLERKLLSALEEVARQQMRSVSGMIRLILAENVARYDGAAKSGSR